MFGKVQWTCHWSIFRTRLTRESHPSPFILSSLNTLFHLTQMVSLFIYWLISRSTTCSFWGQQTTGWPSRPWTSVTAARIGWPTRASTERVQSSCPAKPRLPSSNGPCAPTSSTSCSYRKVTTLDSSSSRAASARSVWNILPWAAFPWRRPSPSLRPTVACTVCNATRRPRLTSALPAHAHSRVLWSVPITEARLLRYRWGRSRRTSSPPESDTSLEPDDGGQMVARACLLVECTRLNKLCQTLARPSL